MELGGAILVGAVAERQPNDLIMFVSAGVALLGMLAAARRARLVAGPSVAEVDPHQADPVNLAPAIVSYLVNGAVVSSQTVPAALSDLVQRGRLAVSPDGRIQRGPDTRFEHAAPLWERRIVCAYGGDRPIPEPTIPLRRALSADLAAAAGGRGFTTRRWPRSLVALMAACLATSVVAFAIALPDGDVAWDFASVVALGALTLLGALTIAVAASRRQCLTAQGHEVARSWLARRPGATGAQAIALGNLQPAAPIGPVPDDDRQAWTSDPSAVTRVRYPIVWPPGAGRHPAVNAGAGLLGCVTSAAAAASAVSAGKGIGWIDFGDLGPTRIVAVLFWAVIAVVQVWSAAWMLLGLADLGLRDTFSGTIVRRRTGVRAPVEAGLLARALDARRATRRYVAVAPDGVDRVAALVTDRPTFERVGEGERVKVVMSPFGRHVWRMESETSPAGSTARPAARRSAPR